ncbi:hypothetical protein [Lentzea terrae]|uniref:hypothetical protein n=1 Tax=Lentzea terrae TaxID=2200761 RepID=UPI000DD39D37|nr:hypothetical protein [Lentzea terrae]
MLRVGGGGFRDIGSAIAAARDGDVVEISGGTYVEQLTVDKAVELRAVKNTGAVELVGERTPLMLRAGATARTVFSPATPKRPTSSHSPRTTPPSPTSPRTGRASLTRPPGTTT